MVIIGTHIQTTVTVVIFFVFSWWIVNDFENYEPSPPPPPSLETYALPDSNDSKTIFQKEV